MDSRPRPRPRRRHRPPRPLARQRGWDAVLADVSDQGLAIAAQRAAATNVPLTTRCESAAETLEWAKDRPFDIILVIWCLVRDSFTALPSALAAGGTLLYKTYTSAHTRYAQGHSLNTALDPGELRTAFPTLPTVLYRESNGVAELVARSELAPG